MFCLMMFISCKDYQLQVIIFCTIEYGEQMDAQVKTVQFMTDTYLKDGAADIFTKTAAKFNLPQKYIINFDLLQQNAKLPLKLLLLHLSWIF
ncbi:hypothetical protein CS542_08840 [Pedobacter sp. IW39]|nr:hypothetical protein CS542_08840 [Pedobacter sp. IW39]